MDYKLSATKFYRKTYPVSFVAITPVPKTVLPTWFAINKQPLKE